VSKREGKAKKGSPEAQAFHQLEEAVNGAVAQLKELRGRLGESQDEGREMRELLRKFIEGEEDPALLLSRLRSLESENQEFLVRLKKGKEGVERLLARIRFLEEQG
jgi:predicted RNase H-like nuclease (RuvC/YqgF family)